MRGTEDAGWGGVAPRSLDPFAVRIALLAWAGRVGFGRVQRGAYERASSRGESSTEINHPPEGDQAWAVCFEAALRAWIISTATSAGETPAIRDA